MVCLACLVAAGCGGGGSRGAIDAGAVVVDGGDELGLRDELSPLPIGLPTVEAFGYAAGLGQKHLRRAREAEKRGDWRVVREACEDAIAADPFHLEAHRLLASAIANLGEARGVLRHLSIAVAGDPLRYGRDWERDPSFAPLRAGAIGGAMAERMAAYRAELGVRAQKGVLVVGRRIAASALRAGAHDVRLRAEIYAWDGDTGRFLRVSRTNQGVAAFVRSPSGERLAYVAVTRARGASAKTGQAARLLEARVGLVDLVTPAMSPRTVPVRDAPDVRLGWDEAGRLVSLGSGALARPELVDVLHGRRRAIDKVAPVTSIAVVEPGSVWVGGLAPAAIEADWHDDGGSRGDAITGAFRLTTSNKTVTLPAGAHARRSSLVWSPGRARVAFTTWADPCAADADRRVVLVYVVDAASGRLRLVHRGESLGVLAWIDEERLAIEDGAQAVQVLDIAESSARVLARLTAPGGLGLGRVPAIGRSACQPGSERDVFDDGGGDEQGARGSGSDGDDGEGGGEGDADDGPGADAGPR